MLGRDVINYYQVNYTFKSVHFQILIQLWMNSEIMTQDFVLNHTKPFSTFLILYSISRKHG